MPLLGRISITSGHSVVPFVCPYFYRSFPFCLAFLLPFVWFATARNDIAPSRLYSILSSLISFPICVHARKVRRETFPRPICSFPFSAPLLAYCFTSITHHRLSPVHLLLLSVQHDSIFIPICLSSAGCLRGLALSVMLNLFHSLILSLLHSSNAHALLLTCAALCLLCLISTFVY